MVITQCCHLRYPDTLSLSTSSGENLFNFASLTFSPPFDYSPPQQPASEPPSTSVFLPVPAKSVLRTKDRKPTNFAAILDHMLRGNWEEHNTEGD